MHIHLWKSYNIIGYLEQTGEKCSRLAVMFYIFLEMQEMEFHKKNHSNYI